MGNMGASMMWLVAILSAGPLSAQPSSYTPLSLEEYQEAIATKFPVKAALAIDERVRLSATCFPPYEGEFRAVMSFRLSGKVDLEVLSLATSLGSEGQCAFQGCLASPASSTGEAVERQAKSHGS